MMMIHDNCESSSENQSTWKTLQNKGIFIVIYLLFIKDKMTVKAICLFLVILLVPLYFIEVKNVRHTVIVLSNKV